MSYISNRVIMITGAASGIGRLLATMAAARGASIIACDVNVDELHSTVSEIVDSGGVAIAVETDVTVCDDVRRAVREGIESFGRVDVLVNNAGTMPLAFLADHDKAGDAWGRCIDINLKGVLNGISAVYDHMIEQGRGHIVNLSSIYGNRPTSGGSVYGATKAAVNYLSDSLRQEAQGKIKVTVVRPTGIPNTGLAGTVINQAAEMGAIGGNSGELLDRVSAIRDGESKASWFDSDNIEYFMLELAPLVEQILYVIDQPWGVSISDLTIRSSGELFAI